MIFQYVHNSLLVDIFTTAKLYKLGLCYYVVKQHLRCDKLIPELLCLVECP